MEHTFYKAHFLIHTENFVAFLRESHQEKGVISKNGQNLLFSLHITSRSMHWQPEKQNRKLKNAFSKVTDGKVFTIQMQVFLVRFTTHPKFVGTFGNNLVKYEAQKC